MGCPKPNGPSIDEGDVQEEQDKKVIQRVLNQKITLLDTNKVISPHNSFRLFATANTVGLGDTTGLYHGTQQNQGQRIDGQLLSPNYLPVDAEVEIVLAKVPSGKQKWQKTIQKWSLYWSYQKRIYVRRYFNHYVS